MTDTSGTEDGGGENCDTSNTNPLLHNLKPDDKLDTTTSMKLAGADTKEHSKVGGTTGRLPLKLSDVANVLKFSLGLTDILAILTTKTSEYIASLPLTTDLDEPARRFREVEDGDQEHNERGDLEANGKSPGKAGLAAFVEVAAILDPVSNTHTKDV